MPKLINGVSVRIFLGGPYSLFAGRDASRALGKFVVNPAVIKDDDDDLSDLTSSEMDSIREWETQFIGTTSYKNFRNAFFWQPQPIVFIVF